MASLQKWFNAIVFIALAVVLFFVWRDENRTRAADARIQEIEKKADLVRAYDSISSVRANHKIDSLKNRTSKLESSLKSTVDETKTLRRQNAAIEKKYRDIVLGDRPDF